MKMKHVSTVLALVFSSAVTSAIAAPVTVEAGTVNFTGSVVDTACAVDTASTNLNVNMGQVRLAALGTTAGTQAPSRTDFQIKLVDCDVSTIQNAQITFNGVTSQGDPSVLEAGVGAGKATGVGVQIFDHTGSALPVGTASTVVQLNAGDNTLHFQSGFISTSTSPTAGDASASSTFTITYS